MNRRPKTHRKKNIGQKNSTQPSMNKWHGKISKIKKGSITKIRGNRFNFYLTEKHNFTFF